MTFTSGLHGLRVRLIIPKTFVENVEAMSVGTLKSYLPIQTVLCLLQVSGPQRQTGQPLASVSPSVFQMANRSGDADSSNADDYYFSDGSDST